MLGKSFNFNAFISRGGILSGWRSGFGTRHIAALTAEESDTVQQMYQMEYIV